MINIVFSAILFVNVCYGIAGNMEASEAAGVIIIELAYLAFATYLW